ncbi:hypothetical protein BGZ51_002744 [Haplosporangium sp. Z 767]|nr:hypothetical protein BGZ51_002744 [Haplosporangium sp. Z 767]KAF9196217.1 hypothetical protein BGZ50_001619 [Haplosporangium sp. Z 11]
MVRYEKDEGDINIAWGYDEPQCGYFLTVVDRRLEWQAEASKDVNQICEEVSLSGGGSYFNLNTYSIGGFGFRVSEATIFAFMRRYGIDPTEIDDSERRTKVYLHPGGETPELRIAPSYIVQRRARLQKIYMESVDKPVPIMVARVDRLVTELSRQYGIPIVREGLMPPSDLARTIFFFAQDAYPTGFKECGHPDCRFPEKDEVKHKSPKILAQQHHFSQTDMDIINEIETQAQSIARDMELEEFLHSMDEWVPAPTSTVVEAEIVPKPVCKVVTKGQNDIQKQASQQFEAEMQLERALDLLSPTPCNNDDPCVLYQTTTVNAVPDTFTFTTTAAIPDTSSIPLEKIDFAPLLAHIPAPDPFLLSSSSAPAAPPSLPIFDSNSIAWLTPPCEQHLSTMPWLYSLPPMVTSINASSSPTAAWCGTYLPDLSMVTSTFDPLAIIDPYTSLDFLELQADSTILYNSSTTGGDDGIAQYNSVNANLSLHVNKTLVDQRPRRVHTSSNSNSNSNNTTSSGNSSIRSSSQKCNSRKGFAFLQPISADTFQGEDSTTPKKPRLGRPPLVRMDTASDYHPQPVGPRRDSSSALASPPPSPAFKSAGLPPQFFFVTSDIPVQTTDKKRDGRSLNCTKLLKREQAKALQARSIL